MAKNADFEAQLERLLDKEKIARVNNEHVTSVAVLKDIVPSISIRSLSADRPKNGHASTSKSPSS